MKRLQYIKPETQVFSAVISPLLDTISGNMNTAGTINNGELDAREGDGDWEDTPWEE